MKFADVTPTLEECQRTLLAAERVVRATMPASVGTPLIQAAEVRA